MCPFMWRQATKYSSIVTRPAFCWQKRREVPTQQDILAPSFKTAASLTEGEALALAAELHAARGELIAGFQPERSDEETA